MLFVSISFHISYFVGAPGVHREFVGEGSPATCPHNLYTPLVVFDMKPKINIECKLYFN